jgi:hypothetical protein
VVTFEPISSRETRVTVDLAWEPQGLTERIGSTLGIDQMEVRADLERFKEFIEARDTDSGRWRGRTSSDVRAEPSPAEPRPSTMPEAYDVVDVLRTQHQQIKRLFLQTAEAYAAARGQHLADLLLWLELHEKGEQQVVHPVTRSTGEAGGETAQRRLAEEREVDELVSAIQHIDVASAECDAQFARLRDAVENHAEQVAEEFHSISDEPS